VIDDNFGHHKVKLTAGICGPGFRRIALFSLALA
jgi:hypothetical protein